MRTKRLHIDFETYSDYDITNGGHIAYAKDPSTEILMAAYRFSDEPVKLWDASKQRDMPQDLIDGILDPTIIKYAHNASFEIAILLYALPRQLGWSFVRNGGKKELYRFISMWRCTQVMGHTMSLPSSLEQQGLILQGSDSESLKTAKRGKALIRKFCLPRKPTKKDPSARHDHNSHPEEWQEFCGYCMQDVVAEHANYKKLARFPIPEHEWDLWHQDQIINFTGLPIDLDLVDACIGAVESVTEHFMKVFKDLTGLDNPNSRNQLLPWLKELGYPSESLAKDDVQNTITRAVDEDGEPLDARLIQALKLRLLTNRNGYSKFYTLKYAARDGRLCGGFQFAGAGRTWRWGGRIFQPQNLPRGSVKVFEKDDGTLDLSNMHHAIDLIKTRDMDFITAIEDIDDLPDMLTSLVRPSIGAPKGKTLTVADLSAIEAVMTGWAANSEYMLDLFRKGLDPYKDYATKLYGVAYDDVDKKLRTFCKPPVLGCCYRLGADGLIAYAEGMGVFMDFDEASKAVTTYREGYPDVPKLWDALDHAAMQCIKTKEPQTVNGKFTFEYKSPCMTIKLPSGRKLVYVRPRIEQKTFTYRDKITRERKTATAATITYEGLNQKTRRWERMQTHGGKLTENIVQAIARDVLAHGLMKCRDADLEVVGHVHDEIITLTEDDADYKHVLVNCMTDLPDWCPDLPLNASSYQAPFFIKD